MSDNRDESSGADGTPPKRQDPKFSRRLSVLQLVTLLAMLGVDLPAPTDPKEDPK